jgi:protein-S-isoprenylcysteine O-methyltransferase Ste14
MKFRKRFFKLLKQLIDSFVYVFILPFAVLYIFPKFFREIELSFFELPYNFWFNISGVILMWSGAIIATWCGLLMLINKYGSVVPFFKPKTLITGGPYRIVRHPMMWCLFMVLVGEAFSFSSVFTILWLLIWARFSYILVEKHEDPFLLKTFGDEYLEYSKKVPRWIPGSKPIPIVTNKD